MSKDQAQPFLWKLTQDYKNKLTEQVKDFLVKKRMLSAEVIKTFNLGLNGTRISIPIKSANDELVDIRLYLPEYERTKTKASKITGVKAGDGSAKLFPYETFDLIRLKRHRDGIEEVENLEILEKLETLESVYRGITNWEKLFLVEGELDALALLSVGLLAITNTCGAKTWNDNFAEIIARQNMPITICMDADDPGEEGMFSRADSLLEHNITVSTVNWPHERSVGHDVTDELATFGLDSLTTILESARPYRDVIYLNEVVAEKIDWLFEPYIPVGKTSLIEGHPGIGKTFLTLKVAAAVTRGGNFKDQELKEPSVVLLLSAEDGLADTIKPRLEKMDVDLSKIIAPRELFTLDENGFDSLKKLIEKYKPRLVIIDPMMPFLDGKKDSNKASDMRPFFKQLGKIAERNKCAIVVTRHLAKNPDQRGVTSGLGSIDISAAVRSILQVSEHSEDKGLKQVHHIKCNIGQKGKPFGYRIVDGSFQWAEVQEQATEDCDSQSEIKRANDFLFEALKNGPMKAREVMTQAKDLGFSTSTLNRSKKLVGVRSKKISNGGTVSLWEWYLPGFDGQKEDDQDTQHSQEFRQSSFEGGADDYKG